MTFFRTTAARARPAHSSWPISTQFSPSCIGCQHIPRSQRRFLNGSRDTLLPTAAAPATRENINGELTTSASTVDGFSGHTTSHSTSVTPPTGSLSIVFTDVVKSTAIWESNSPAMTDAMNIHDSIIRRATEAYHGYEVKQNGDGFMIAFATAVSSISFCLSVQQELNETAWPKELLELPPGKVSKDEEGNVLFKGLRLRMSAHWGEPVCNWNEIIGRMDYLGPTVNRAARFIEVTEGGQIVVSEEFLARLEKERRNDDVDNQATKSDDMAELGPIWKDCTVSQADPSDSIQSFKAEANTQVVADLDDFQSPGNEGPGQNSPLPIDHQFEVRLLGRHQFKGIHEPQKLYFIIPHSLRGRLDHWPKQVHVPGSKGNIISQTKR